MSRDGPIFASFGQLGSLPEVVFVPGLGAPGYLAPWAEQVGLVTRSTVLDLPGWRRGRARFCAPTLSGIAEVAVELLARANRPVVLVGHSTGAQSAALVADRAPALVAAVVLAGPTFDPTTHGLAGLALRAVRTLGKESPRELKAVLPHYARSGVLPLIRLLMDAWRRDGEVYRQFPMPTLVMTGRQDHIAPPAWARTLAGQVGGTPIVVLGGHNFSYTHPLDAATALAATVAQIGPV
jgi:pimeloyl-ACP methyl ester carboxylesterase